MLLLFLLRISFKKTSASSLFNNCLFGITVRFHSNDFPWLLVVMPASGCNISLTSCCATLSTSVAVLQVSLHICSTVHEVHSEVVVAGLNWNLLCSSLFLLWHPAMPKGDLSCQLNGNCPGLPVRALFLLVDASSWVTAGGSKCLLLIYRWWCWVFGKHLWGN